MTCSSQKQRRAFSLIEAIIVLAIVGLVIGGIWAATASARLQMKVSDSVILVKTVLTEINRGFPDPNNQLTASAYLDSTLIAMKAIPPNYARDANYAFHPFGGQFRVRVGITPNYVRVVFYRLTARECVALVNSLVTPARNFELGYDNEAFGMYQIGFPSSGTIDDPDIYKRNGTLISTAATECAGSGTTTTFYYNLGYIG